MGYFKVRVMQNGKPASDVGVAIDYDGEYYGFDEKRTNSDGWVEFHNRENHSGRIWVHNIDMGSHGLEDGNKYSFTI